MYRSVLNANPLVTRKGNHISPWSHVLCRWYRKKGSGEAWAYGFESLLLVKIFSLFIPSLPGSLACTKCSDQVIPIRCPIQNFILSLVLGSLAYTKKKWPDQAMPISYPVRKRVMTCTRSRSSSSVCSTDSMEDDQQECMSKIKGLIMEKGLSLFSVCHNNHVAWSWVTP
jgi:hypothetical protein